MRMNSGIIGSIPGVDLAGATREGNAMRMALDEERRGNALRGFMRENGAAIARGDQGALDAYAGYDPEAAFSMRAGHAQERRAEAGERREEGRFEMLREQGRRQAAEAMRALSAEQAAAEREQIERGVAALSAAQGDEQWDRYAVQFGVPDLVGRFEDREAIMSYAMGAKEAMELNGGGNPDSEAERQVRRIMETGVDRNTAILIRDNVIATSRDPVTGEVVMIDQRSGQPWGEGGGQPPALGQPQPPAMQPQPMGGEAPADTAAPGPGMFDRRSERNADEAFGVGGAARRVANTVSDTLGRGPIFESAQEAHNEFSFYGEQVLNDIAGGYNRPPSWLLQNIRELIPAPGNPFQGADSAASQIRVIGRSLRSELDAQEAALDRRRLRPTERAEIERRVGALTGAIARTEDMYSYLTGEGRDARTMGEAREGSTTGSGVGYRMVR